MNRIRTAANLMAAAGVVSAGVLGFAAPAAAATSYVAIDNASSLTVKSVQTLTVSGNVASYCQAGLNSRTATIALEGPSGSAPVTTTLSTSVRVACNRDISVGAAFDTPQRNGSYVVKLDSKSTEETATLSVLVAPARTTGFQVTSSGTTAAFTWAANPEVDVIGYEVTMATGTNATTVGAGACSAGSCMTNVDLGSAVAGNTERFSVRALRCGLSCGDPVEGPRSASAGATFGKVTPTSSPTPTPTPTPTKTHGNGNGGSTHLSSGGGHHHGTGQHHSRTTGDQGKKHHRSAFGPGTIPVLHLPKNLGNLPNLQTKSKPVVIGNSGGTLSHPGPKLATASKSQPRTTTQSITHDIATGLQLPPLWRGIAAAVILLLIATHLRAWSARVDLS